MNDRPPGIASRPCASCPYAKRTPPGIWDATEYAKLKAYDAPLPQQPPGLFLCHSLDGNLCAGWIACHGTDNLLALRFQEVQPEVYDFRCPIPVFPSGTEAAEAGVAPPDERSERAIRRVIAKRAKNRRKMHGRDPMFERLDDLRPKIAKAIHILTERFGVDAQDDAEIAAAIHDALHIVAPDAALRIERTPGGRLAVHAGPPDGAVVTVGPAGVAAIAAGLEMRPTDLLLTRP